MSLNVFPAFCILGVAFMMYALPSGPVATNVAHMVANCRPARTPS